MEKSFYGIRPKTGGGWGGVPRQSVKFILGNTPLIRKPKIPMRGGGTSSTDEFSKKVFGTLPNVIAKITDFELCSYYI